MAKQVVRYLLEGNGTVPIFIHDGGYWPIGFELVGLSVDENERHVPNTVVRMSRADLLARIATLEMRDSEGELLDEAAQEAALDSWLEMIGLPDLA